ncbi:MAG TPA: glycerate kinase [Actinomycetota bacterium]|jgi:glycerate kinase|nr:glycerate kinase [Actinomycetota bacterium]
MRVLVAPDKFRGTLTAREAGDAIARGWHRARPQDEVEVVPLADGGEGTLDALAPPDDPAATRSTRRVTGPLGEPVDADVGLRGETAVVEMARASGLELVPAERRDPLRTTTRGTGELMASALEAGARRLLVCLGGSATNDGGVGMAAALGGRFLDADGAPIADGGGGLMALARLDASPVLERLRSVEVVGVTDVDNPLCGPAGASAVFGPQKGASPEDVVLLDRALAHLAAIASRDLGADRSHEPGAGAAGGLGFGLLAFTGARLRRGVDVVMEAVGFRERLATASLVITAEGSFDASSLRGKVPAGVLEASELAGVPAAVLCGVASADVPGAVVRSLVDLVGPDVALTDARGSLAQLAEALATDPEILVHE